MLYNHVFIPFFRFVNMFANKKFLAISPQKYFSHPLVLKTYGSKDLAEKPAFQGGYINFGYWKDIKLEDKEISQEERIRASEALYDLAIGHLKIESKDKVLEIGCGRGNGCAKIAQTIKPLLMAGIDITPEQIERAERFHKSNGQENPSLSFQVGSSDSIPFPDEYFTKAYSVEAAQCFPSMLTFAQEAWRVLEKGGHLVITAHFATGEAGYQALRTLIPTVDQGVDRLVSIEKVRSYFFQIGFEEVLFKNIGYYVFEGFHRWRLQVGDTKWVDAVFESYKKGYMGYYLIHLRK